MGSLKRIMQNLNVTETMENRSLDKVLRVISAVGTVV